MKSIKSFFIKNKEITSYTLAAIFIYLFITCFFFYPSFFGNNIIVTNDIQQHQYATQEITSHRQMNGEEPLWTGSMFAGMPTYQLSTLYSGNWLMYIDMMFKAFLPHPSGSIFLLGIGFYIFLLFLKVKPKFALIGGIFYALSTFFIVALVSGHNSKISAIGYLPPLLGAIIYSFKNSSIKGFLFVMIFSSLEVYSNHFQITYYGFMLIGFIIFGFLIEFIRENKTLLFFKKSSLILLAFIIGNIPNIGNILCTMEYIDYSTRGGTKLTIDNKFQPNTHLNTNGLDRDYASMWSNDISETSTFLIPNFKGGSTKKIVVAFPEIYKKHVSKQKQFIGEQYAYFGNQPFTEGPAYMSCILVFLFIIGLFIVKHQLKKYLLMALTLAIALSWGKNFQILNNLFYEYFPFYSKFRSVNMILVLVVIILTFFAVLTIKKISEATSLNQIIFNFRNRAISLKKVLWFAFILISIFCLTSIFLPSVTNTFLSEEEESKLLLSQFEKSSNEKLAGQVSAIYSLITDVRIKIVTQDTWRTLFFITLVFGLIFSSFYFKFFKKHIVLFISILIIIDLTLVDKRFLNKTKFEKKSFAENALNKKEDIDIEILKDSSIHYRVVDISSNTFDNARIAKFHKTIGGYNAAKLSIYNDLIDFHLKKELNLFSKEIKKSNATDSSIALVMPKLKVVNMLNTKYFILSAGNNQKALYENKNALGDSWLISDIIKVKDPNEEIKALSNIKPLSEITIQNTTKNNKYQNHYNNEGSIKLTEYKANYLAYNYNSSAKSFAVFSEIYYPKGWNAYIDGKPSVYEKVNYALRGMEIPAGTHKIEFKFEPNTYLVANKIAMYGSILFYLIISTFLVLFLQKAPLAQSNLPLTK